MIDVKPDTRCRLRSALKYGLKRHSDVPFTDYQGKLKEWFMWKLDTMAAYGLADLARITERQRNITNLYFFEGATIQHLVSIFSIQEKQIYKDINRVLDLVIDTAPVSLLKKLSIPQYLFHSCPHCGGTLAWDRDGAHGDGEGEYRCLHCSRRYTFDLKLIN